MSDALVHLLQAGILGPVLVVAILFILRQSKQLNGVQEKRVQESKEVTDSIIRITERYVAALNANTRALDANRKAFEELKETLQSLDDHE